MDTKGSECYDRYYVKENRFDQYQMLVFATKKKGQYACSALIE